MTATGFLTRVVLRNYKSIATCDVALGPLTYLVGANGSGKSNFVDGLHLVRDALTGSLDNALNERGGLSLRYPHKSAPQRHSASKAAWSFATHWSSGPMASARTAAADLHCSTVRSSRARNRRE